MSETVEEQVSESVARYETLMREARKENASRDRGDKRAGWASPGDTDHQSLLRTAMSAIQAGIASQDWTAVAEGQAMLEQATGGFLRPGVGDGGEAAFKEGRRAFHADRNAENPHPRHTDERALWQAGFESEKYR